VVAPLVSWSDQRRDTSTLSDHASNCARRALAILNAERNARVVPKVELGKVAVQVLFAAMLIHAAHAALEDRIVASTVLGGSSSPARSARTRILHGEQCRG